MCNKAHYIRQHVSISQICAKFTSTRTLYVFYHRTCLLIFEFTKKQLLHKALSAYLHTNIKTIDELVPLSISMTTEHEWTIIICKCTNCNIILLGIVIHKKILSC